MESKRCAGGRVVQRPVLYLGEINDSQRAAWCRVIEAFDVKKRNDPRNWRCLLPGRAVPDHAKAYGVPVRLDRDGVASAAAMESLLAGVRTL